MSDPHQSEASPLERIEDLPRIERALQQAVREALQRHKLAGNPVAIWRNDRVEWVQPADIPTFTDGEQES